MKIIIAGSGDTGTHLAKMLSNEGQDVTLMSDDRRCLTNMDAAYNLMVVLGDPVSREDQLKAGVADADLFVAVTPSETINIIAASMARFLGASACVTRVSRSEYMSPELEGYFSNLRIDTRVYPEMLVADEIEAFIERNWVTGWFELCTGQLVLAGVRPMADAPVCGRALRDIPELRQLMHVSAVRRNRHILIPSGNDTLRPDDTVFFTLRPDDMASLQSMTGVSPCRVRNIMIYGATPMTRILVPRLKDNHNLTVVDPDYDACRELSALFSDIPVVNTSARDLDTLQVEGIEQMDMFIALSGRDENNILSCMSARELGVPRTVAQVEDVGYMAEAERLSISKVVNKKLITSSTILRHIMGSTLRVEAMISLPDTEVAEVGVRPGSRIAAAPVRSLKLPKGMTFGGLIRSGRGMLVDGDTRFEPGDKVMVIFLPGMLDKIMHQFH